MKKLKSGFLTLIGLPNAGKSSLLNKIIGTRLAIVSPKAQTTWSCLRGFLSRDDVRLAITDTPGLHEGSIALNNAIRKNALMAVKLANSDKKTETSFERIAWVVDAKDFLASLYDKTTKAYRWDQDTLERAIGKESIAATVFRNEGLKLPLTIRAVLVFNKIDLLRTGQLDALKEHMPTVIQTAQSVFSDIKESFLVSTKADDGQKSVDSFLNAIVETLPETSLEEAQIFDEETLTDQPLRYFAGEYLREQCYLQLGAELPYSVAVEIDEFREEPNLMRVHAVVHVERESQKPIVLGRGGLKMKSMATEARLRMEELFGCKVFLGVKVKVSPQWAREAHLVNRFGYQQK